MVACCISAHLLSMIICQSETPGSDIPHRGSAQDTHDLRSAATIIRHGEHVRYARCKLPQVACQAIESSATAENHQGWAVQFCCCC